MYIIFVFNIKIQEVSFLFYISLSLKLGDKFELNTSSSV